jgi:hypothetical protein
MSGYDNIFQVQLDMPLKPKETRARVFSLLFKPLTKSETQFFGTPVEALWTEVRKG